jgi:hypothetical protein
MFYVSILPLSTLTNERSTMFKKVMEEANKASDQAEKMSDKKLKDETLICLATHGKSMEGVIIGAGQALRHTLYLACLENVEFRTALIDVCSVIIEEHLGNIPLDTSVN